MRIVSVSESLPAAASCAIAVLVKILLIEPRLNFVSMLTGTRNSRFASPYAFSKNGVSFAGEQNDSGKLVAGGNVAQELVRRRGSLRVRSLRRSAGAFTSGLRGSTLSTLIPVSKWGGSGSTWNANRKKSPFSAFIRSSERSRRRFLDGDDRDPLHVLPHAPVDRSRPSTGRCRSDSAVKLAVQKATIAFSSPPLKTETYPAARRPAAVSGISTPAGPGPAATVARRMGNTPRTRDTRNFMEASSEAETFSRPTGFVRAGLAEELDDEHRDDRDRADVRRRKTQARRASGVVSASSSATTARSRRQPTRMLVSTAPSGRRRFEEA